MEIYELTVHELADMLEKKEITSQQIVESYLARIDDKEPEVKAFISQNRDNIIEYAKKNR